MDRPVAAEKTLEPAPFCAAIFDVAEVNAKRQCKRNRNMDSRFHAFPICLVQAPE